MQKIYCAKCGSVNHYEIKKPNVCAYCSTSFNAAFIKPVEPPKKLKKKVGAEEDYEERGDDMEEVTSIEISKLKQIAKAAAKRVNVSIAKKMTLGDLSKMENPIIRDSVNPNSLPPKE